MNGVNSMTRAILAMRGAYRARGEEPNPAQRRELVALAWAVALLWGEKSVPSSYLWLAIQEELGRDLNLYHQAVGLGRRLGLLEAGPETVELKQEQADKWAAEEFRRAKNAER